MRENLLLEDLDLPVLDWMEGARCLGLPMDWWVGPGHEVTAVRVCMRCPVRQQCAEHAELGDERFGIWGGQVRGWPWSPASSV